MKRFVCMALALLLSCSLLLRVNASGSEVGSIEIKVEYNNTKITGGELIAVRVGYVDSENAVFRRVTDHLQIDHIGKQAAVTLMQNFYDVNKNSHTFAVYKTDVKNGLAKFNGLSTGLYLIYQDTPADGYEKLNSFLVTLPYDGQMDVSALSKPSLEKEQEKETEPTETSPGGGGGGGGQKLPQTGQLTWPIPWMAISGMVLFVLGWWLCFGRRKDSQ